MGPGDRAFVRWAKRHIGLHDAKRVLVAYKEAKLIDVDNRTGTFRVLDFAAVSPDALEAAADNVRPARPKRWNDLSDEERMQRVESATSLPDQWERQERAELARAKLDARNKR